MKILVSNLQESLVQRWIKFTHLTPWTGKFAVSKDNFIEIVFKVTQSTNYWNMDEWVSTQLFYTSSNFVNKERSWVFIYFVSKTEIKEANLQIQKNDQVLNVQHLPGSPICTWQWVVSIKGPRYFNRHLTHYTSTLSVGFTCHNNITSAGAIFNVCSVTQCG